MPKVTVWYNGRGYTDDSYVEALRGRFSASEYLQLTGDSVTTRYDKGRGLWCASVGSGEALYAPITDNTQNRAAWHALALAPPPPGLMIFVDGLSATTYPAALALYEESRLTPEQKIEKWAENFPRAEFRVSVAADPASISQSVGRGKTLSEAVSHLAKVL